MGTVLGGSTPGPAWLLGLGISYAILVGHLKTILHYNESVLGTGLWLPYVELDEVRFQDSLIFKGMWLFTFPIWGEAKG